MYDLQGSCRMPKVLNILEFYDLIRVPLNILEFYDFIRVPLNILEFVVCAECSRMFLKFCNPVIQKILQN